MLTVVRFYGLIYENPKIRGKKLDATQKLLGTAPNILRQMARNFGNKLF